MIMKERKYVNLDRKQEKKVSKYMEEYWKRRKLEA